MENLFGKMIASALQIEEIRVMNTIALLDSGATVPFMARYRKEKTGALDEVQISDIKNQYESFNELKKRKETVLSTIKEQGKLTTELRKRIDGCWNATELEDMYLPYKFKRKTRAEVARQKGLQPLADVMMKQNERDIEGYAVRFMKGSVVDAEDALKGARDIIAERVSENERSRNQVRNAFARQAVITSKVVKEKKEEAVKYRDYFDFSELLKKCTSHRLLALRRGEAEGFLRVSISPADEQIVENLNRQYVCGNTSCGKQVAFAVSDAYKRLLKPSIENEFAAQSKKAADEEAIRVFAANLKQLLLAAPLGQKRVLGLDPGFRTGCKTVCLDAQGSLLYHTAIFPHEPKSDFIGASATMQKLVKQYHIEAIAIGNGTASRETERFLKALKFEHEVQVFVVSEDGASIYSASKTAREEFPEEDVTVRGAVSIARRLMDPLAELVKIEAKNLGIGQYQHDVDQILLKKSLDQTVESCVNSVGVNVNTASKHLLMYVSGLGPTLAQNIVDYRKQHGAFKSRKQLLEVPKMGAKTFEQSAGFLRVSNAENPLDNSAVHPERYHVVELMAKDNGCTIKELISNKKIRNKVGLKQYVTSEVGLPTLNDIMDELDKPGRDPREQLHVFEFDQNIHDVKDLREGMVLPGIVNNITNFGAFVDIGVHEKGLVHISQIVDKYVTDPTTVFSIGQHVKVRVMSVDMERNRISLSMKDV